MKNIIKNTGIILTDDEKKWVTVFNEIQHRVDVVFEAFVAFFSVNVFIENLLNINPELERIMLPLKHKSFIYRSYLYVELHNLLDEKGKSSITKFVNYWYGDLIKGGHDFTKIFGDEVEIKVLRKHFDVFKKWYDSKKEKIHNIKVFRDKNFSHIDHDFEYNNQLNYEILLELIVFLSDFSTIMINTTKVSNFRVFKGEPVGIIKFVQETTDINKVRKRLRQEINAISNMFSFDQNGKKNLVLNCLDSIDLVLNKVKLIKIRQ